MFIVRADTRGALSKRPPAPRRRVSFFSAFPESFSFPHFIPVLANRASPKTHFTLRNVVFNTGVGEPFTFACSMNANQNNRGESFKIGQRKYSDFRKT
jgi:hypothetical protein